MELVLNGNQHLNRHFDLNITRHASRIRRQMTHALVTSEQLVRFLHYFTSKMAFIHSFIHYSSIHCSENTYLHIRVRVIVTILAQKTNGVSKLFLKRNIIRSFLSIRVVKEKFEA